MKVFTSVIGKACSAPGHENSFDPILIAVYPLDLESLASQNVASCRMNQYGKVSNVFYSIISHSTLSVINCQGHSANGR